MEIDIRRRDVYVVALAVTLFFSWAAYATYDNRRIHEELRERAEVHIDEWFATEPEGTDRDDYEHVAIVDSEKAFRYFGRAWGIIHVYIRDVGDTECKTFKGLEYYYVRQEDEWVLMDTVGCGAKEHHIRAFDHYLAQGLNVEDRVFDETFGLDFDYKRYLARIAEREGDAGAIVDESADGHDHDHDHGHGHGHDHSDEGVHHDHS